MRAMTRSRRLVAFLALIFVRGKRLNIATLAALILIFLLPYWHRAAA